MTGRTKDAGWQVGARRTLPLETSEAWDLLTSQPWLRRWSGLTELTDEDPAVASLTVEKVARVHTAESWVQLRLLSAATGTTIAFHEDHLPDERAREARKEYWAKLLDDLQAAQEG